MLVPQLNLLLANKALNLVKCSAREATESFEMGFFFSVDLAALQNARTFLLKIEGQLDDQKDDVFSNFSSCT